MVEVSFPTELAHGYLLLNSVLPLIVAVVASPIAREINNGVSRRLGRGFTVMFAVTIATGVYAVITTILVPIMELYQKECPTIRPRDQVSDRHGVEEAVSSDSVMGIEGGEVTEEEPSTIVVVEEVEAKDLVKRGDFWSRYKISRPASIAVMMAPMCGAFFLLLHHSHGCLYTSTAIIGVCTGAITSVAVSTTTELFGAQNFGINHNILVTNIPIGIGSFIFGDFAAYLYKRQGRISGGSGGICIGMPCFRTTFIIWGCLCFLGTCLAVFFHSRTRRTNNRH
nr:protein NUCLEAR FUSION DEFECTIVE 4-like [Ipomoea trifida]